MRVLVGIKLQATNKGVEQKITNNLFKNNFYNSVIFATLSWLPRKITIKTS
jgi:hypothetical protein